MEGGSIPESSIAALAIPALVHFDRNGFAYTLNRAASELLVGATLTMFPAPNSHAR